jgi:hypothetical protein
MGRTIHLTVEKKESKFTDKELKAMLDVTTKFNSGKFKNVWTCENYWLDAYSYFPNWQNPLYIRLDNQTKIWKDVNKRMDELQKKGMHQYDATKQLLKEGYVRLHGELPKHKVHTFCKVQGNELNALLVLQATIETSKLIPKAELNLSDEGEFLLCPLKIKNGKAIPMVSDLIDSIKYYAFRMILSKGFKGNVLKKLDYKAKDFKHEFMMDSGIENTYGDMTEYVNEKLRNLKLIETALLNSGQIKESNEMYFYNLENRLERKGWGGFDPYLFTRAKQVNPDDFKNYKMNTATLMSGFSGEHFGLSKKDAESESYKAIANIQKILGLDKNNEIKMEILGEKKVS